MVPIFFSMEKRHQLSHWLWTLWTTRPTYQGECAHVQTSSATALSNPLLPNGFEGHPTSRNSYDGNPSQKPMARKIQGPSRGLSPVVEINWFGIKLPSKHSSSQNATLDLNQRSLSPVSGGECRDSWIHRELRIGAWWLLSSKEDISTSPLRNIVRLGS